MARQLPAFREIIALRPVYVMNMLRSLVDKSPTSEPIPTDWPPLYFDRDRSMMRSEHKIALILQEHDCIIGATDLTGAFDDCLQRRTDVGRRRGNHLQDIATSSLINQRLLEIARLG